jgi:hypothetical protein
MPARLSRSLAHRLVTVDVYHLALAWWRVAGRRAEQLKLFGRTDA